MKRLLQINPVLRTSTSTGRIVREIGDTAMAAGWESYIAYSKGRDGIMPCTSEVLPVGDRASVVWHGIVTRLSDRHGLASSAATRRFVKEIERLRPDIIHIHNIHGYFLDYRILCSYLSKCDIPVVWTVHDCWMYTGHCYYYTAAGCSRWQTGCGKCPQRKEFPKSLFVDRSAQNWEDKKNAFTSLPHDRLVVVPVSEWLRQEMSRSFMKYCRFKVIHNGIDTDIFTCVNDREVREKYGLGDRHIILGVASIWSQKKGFGDFIEMSGRLRDDEVIVLVGIEESRLRYLPHNIVGITRTDNVSELAALYSAADVFVNPTWQDNYPTVNLEAISCGTPVVTYGTGGSPESVTSGTGYVIGTGDVPGLLGAVRKIESAGKAAYSTTCRQYATDNFRKEDRYSEYIKLYEELI